MGLPLGGVAQASCGMNPLSDFLSSLPPFLAFGSMDPASHKDEKEGKSKLSVSQSSWCLRRGEKRRDVASLLDLPLCCCFGFVLDAAVAYLGRPWVRQTPLPCVVGCWIVMMIFWCSR